MLSRSECDEKFYWEEIKINRIDGRMFADMMISGANNLYNNKEVVDELNVFPVPDGDTGTNMSMTVSAMVNGLSGEKDLTVTAAADKISFATLRGARGNSGVILSQFFRGISKELKGKEYCTAKEFADALKKGSDAAYKAVMNPTEGTVLTVAREVAQSAVSMAAKTEDAAEMMRYAVQRGNRILERTPEMLPALKAAGVVDAGGRGWMIFLEGALTVLEGGEIVEGSLKTDGERKTAAQKSVDTSSIKYMYCTEFIVEKKNQRVNVALFKKTIENKGDSMLVIDDDEIVKVHIHTNNPGFVIEKALLMGALVNIKIDNMKHQHKSLIEEDGSKTPPAEAKPYGFVGVCAGDGLNKVLKDLGTDITVQGGQTMNPSTEDILAAVEKVCADVIYVFPNNKNIIMASEQAAEISKKNVVVIPTRSIPQCVAALMAFSTEKTPEQNEEGMKKALSNVKTGQITFAVRDTEIEGQEISEGDILGIADGKIETVRESVDEACVELIEKMTDDDSEFVTLYYGEDVESEEAEKMVQTLEEKYPDLEISAHSGGQKLYYYIISVE